MSPTINEYPARIGVDRAEQSAQRVVKTDDKNRGSNRLQILRQKTHPQLFACANDKYGDEQDDEIAFEPEESSEGFQRRHVGVLSDSLALFKSPSGSKNNAAFHSRPARTGLGRNDFSATVGPMNEEANPAAGRMCFRRAKM